MNRGEHTATLHHGTSRIDPLPRTRVNTGETGGGLLLSMGPEVQILSGTPESTAASLFSGFAAFFVPPSPGNFTSVTGRFLYAA